jgi:hypothetical protein
LQWRDVRPLIEKTFAPLPEVDVTVYEPTNSAHTPKKLGTDVLTTARAIVLEAIRRYGILDGTCTPVEVQKLAYFFDRVCAGMNLTSPLKLKFGPNLYGPYADALRHVLAKLEGSFLHCDKRMADAGAADELLLAFAQHDRIKAFIAQPDMREWKMVLDKATDIWTGFESPFDMELLATVDWLQQQAGAVLAVDELMVKIAQWPNADGAARKTRIFDQRVVGIARAQLSKHQALLYG